MTCGGASVFDADDHSGAGIAGGAPGEQADPAAAQPQRVEQFDDEPGAGGALRELGHGLHEAGQAVELALKLSDLPRLSG